MILKILKWLEKAIDLKGSTWVGLFSLTMLIKIWIGGVINGDYIAIYGLVLTSFVANKTIKYHIDNKASSQED